MLSTKTIRVAFALILLVGPGVITLAIGRGLWGVSISGSVDRGQPGVDVELASRSDFYVVTFVVSVAVSILGLILLVRQMRRK